MATIGAIRDRIAELLTAATPSVLGLDRFVEFRNEGDASFLDWCESSAASAFRRFQVRHDGDFARVNVSNGDVEGLTETFTISICYPHDYRAGAQQAISRDKLIDADWHQFNRVCGLYGRGNFFGDHNATVTSQPAPQRLTGASCDFLVIQQQMYFYRTQTL
ncbi:MAG: hypothetical protein E6Q97_38485 [Desulfurellales bacterium]|nr:MAG: hypothetical protein E6Q97_38485 [Desulfurellales bacterium]